MIFLTIIFILNIILRLYRDDFLSKLMKANNFKIEKTSWSMGYTTKELSQLYSQSKSIETNKEIDKIIKIYKLATWSWFGLIALIFLFAILAMFGIDLFQFD